MSQRTILFAAALALTLASLSCRSGGPVSRPGFGAGKGVVVIPIRGMVNSRMLRSVNRRLGEARRYDPALVIVEIDTLGGTLDAALEIGELLFALKAPPTVAYVNRDALGAGAVIAVACEAIVMQEQAWLGDCGLVDGAPGKHPRSDGMDTCVRARFLNFCEGKYPRVLAEAMVVSGLGVYELETVDGTLEWLTDLDYFSLLRSPRRMAPYKDPRTALRVVEGGRLLAVAHDSARRFGFSRATVRSRQEILDLYGLAGHQTIFVAIGASERGEFSS